MYLASDLFPQTLPDGITYVPDFVDPTTESNLILALSKGAWDMTYKRRRKHYGREYAKVGGPPKQGVYTGSLPKWLHAVAVDLQTSGHFTNIPTRSLINEYMPGQGIADHTDADDGVTQRVASLSLGSGAEMRFTDPKGTRHLLYLERRSLVVFEGPVARDWLHGIPGRLSDKIGGLILPRERRVSLTFRENTC